MQLEYQTYGLIVHVKELTKVLQSYPCVLRARRWEVDQKKKKKLDVFIINIQVPLWQESYLRPVSIRQNVLW